MERQLPKNVRQIGNVSDEPKIYVEDYVDTYLNQLKDKAKDEPVGIALAGEILVLEGQPVVYISGAFRLAEVEVRGKEISLKEETVKQMETDRKKYFPETEIVGWGLIEDGKPMGRSREKASVGQRRIISRSRMSFGQYKPVSVCFFWILWIDIHLFKI